MPFWTTKSTTFENGVTYVGGTSAWKDSNGNNKLTTISSSNPTGFVKVNANSNDPIVKNLEYAIQNDGKITYRYGPSGGQFNSIQEVANSVQGYNANTTKLIKDSMRKNLSSSANEYNEKNPDTKVGPSVPPAAPGADPTDPTDPTGVNPTKATEATSNEADANTNKGVSGTLRYPEDIADSQDKIQFDILKYSPRGLETGKFGTETGAGAFQLSSRDSGRKSIATIFLPIPGGISDTNTAGWGDNSMNAFQLIQANTALKSITEGLGKGASVLSEAAQQTSTPAGSDEAKTALSAAFTAFALQGENSQILSRTTGQVLNPNLELLFTGPELRSFNFTFKMSARNKTEADIIVKIIRIFKQSMSPQRSKAQLFVKAPNTFRIQYLHKNGPDHTRIGKIKECALLSMTTNYTPEGQYATYQDGTPISYEIQLQFKELEPVFNDEYSALGDSHIGF